MKISVTDDIRAQISSSHTSVHIYFIGFFLRSSPLLLCCAEFFELIRKRERYVLKIWLLVMNAVYYSLLLYDRFIYVRLCKRVQLLEINRQKCKCQQSFTDRMYNTLNEEGIKVLAQFHFSIQCYTRIQSVHS